MWTHELDYQAASWDEPRRVVLVVKERADDLLLDRFFLVIDLSLRWNGQGCWTIIVSAARPGTHGFDGVLDPPVSTTARNCGFEGGDPRVEACHLLIAMLAR